MATKLKHQGAGIRQTSSEAQASANTIVVPVGQPLTISIEITRGFSLAEFSFDCTPEGEPCVRITTRQPARLISPSFENV